MTCDEDDVTNVWFGYPPRVHLNNTWNKNRLLFNSTKNENEKNKKITSDGSEAEEREREREREREERNRQTFRWRVPMTS